MGFLSRALTCAPVLQLTYQRNFILNFFYCVSTCVLCKHCFLPFRYILCVLTLVNICSASNSPEIKGCTMEFAALMTSCVLERLYRTCWSIDFRIWLHSVRGALLSSGMLEDKLWDDDGGLNQKNRHSTKDFEWSFISKGSTVQMILYVHD